MLKLKRFSGYAENVLTGMGYQSAQVNSQVLGKGEDVINKIDETPIGQVAPVQKKLRLAKMVVSPWRKYNERMKDKYKKER